MNQAADLTPPKSRVPSRCLFVTGRLAETGLRRVLAELGPLPGLSAEVAVLPISVAALMTPRWVERHLQVPQGTDRIILPGHCQGDLTPVIEKAFGASVERGPEDLRDLPRFFGREATPIGDYGGHDIEILAEINHAPRLPNFDLIRQAERFRAEGADVIDVGCDPGQTWNGAGDAVKRLRDEGYRVSIDSFNPLEVQLAVTAGAELVLSVNASNREPAVDWGVEVVAIPDRPGSLDGLEATIEHLERRSVPYRIDPILEPIGFGFATSLERYFAVRRRYPQASTMMGVGNLTELTDVDSAGVNTILIALCQELGIRSVLTTAVINWARSSVREIDLARRLAHYAVNQKTLPKHLEPGLVMLRDPRIEAFGPETLADLQRKIRDPNWRIFAEGGQIHALNNHALLRDADPFELFDRMDVRDPAHAFYLGYEMMKARTALTLGKSYRQDQALEWGFLTVPEPSHMARRKRHPRGDLSLKGRPASTEEQSPEDRSLPEDERDH